MKDTTIFHFGQANIGGELVITPLDEKNLTTDWLEDFLYDCDCAISGDGRICGYVNLGDDDTMLCEAEYDYGCNWVKYTFLHYNYITEDCVEEFNRKLTEFFGDSDNLVIKERILAERKGYEPPHIRLCFYARCEN